MKVWLTQTGEPINGIDGESRRYRSGMLADALTTAGHEVVWWASTFFHTKKQFRAPTERVVQLRSALEVRLLHSPTGYNRNISLWRILHQRQIARRFERTAESLPPPDCVFASLPTIELASAATRFATSRGIASFVDIRDCWPEVYLQRVPPALRSAARLALTSEFRKAADLLHGATAVLAISNSFLSWGQTTGRRSARSLERMFPLGYNARSSVPAPDTIETQLRARFDLAPTDWIVLFVGTFGTSYDLDTVITSARTLAVKAPNVRIVFAGTGDDAGRLRARAAGASNVRFTGWLDQRELAALTSLAKAGIAPYHKQATQSLPNKPFEYMAAGLPFFYSLKGELAELARTAEVGIAYQPGDSSQLAEAIINLQAQPEKRSRMAQRALELFREQFDEAVIYPQIVQHIERVASACSHERSPTI